MDWIYYSSLVPGYTKRYGLSGVRARNKRLLEEAAATTTSTAKDKIAQNLVDNNRPLAMFVACRVGKKLEWEQPQIDDGYQECCIGLLEYSRQFVRKNINEMDSAQGFYQVGAYTSMMGRLSQKVKAKTIENQFERLPFDEETYIETPEPTVNREYLNWIIEIAPVPGYKKEIMMLYYFGDPDLYVEPFCTEDIAMNHNLSRARILQIIDKTRKDIRDFFLYLEKRNPYISFEEFFL